MINGLIVVDKPAGITSHDVVARVRRILQERSVGHLGTLDPMATGVLPLVLGRYTRLAKFFRESTKGYEGEITFGYSTDTYDAEGEPTSEPRDTAQVTLQGLRELAAKLVGRSEQLPPAYSAKKIGGVPAYKLARKSKEVNLEPVPVEIFELEILEYSQGRARFRALVSPGTYIRCLAHELGQSLGCGAHLSALRRTRVGDFTLADAYTLEQLQVLATPAEALVHPRRLLPEIPSVTVSEEAAAYIRNGRAVNLPDMSDSRYVKVFLNQRDLIAIAPRVAGTLFHAGVVLFGNNEAVPVSAVAEKHR